MTDTAGGRAADMPVFVIKAKDNLAPIVVAHYAKLCRDRGLDWQARQVDFALEEIIAWRDAHPEQCKWPHHEHRARNREGDEK